MPELPEVETVARSLRPLVVGWTIADAAVGPHHLRAPLDGTALAALRGHRVGAIDRIGKYLLFRLEPPQGSAPRLLLSHLGMTGRYEVRPRDAEAATHTHVRVDLQQGAAHQQLRYIDPRRFGCVVVHDRPAADIPELQALGPDPLSAAFTAAHFTAALRQTERPLKSALLDQGLVAGLGNIYVVESLHQARLLPERRASSLRKAEAQRLHQVIIEVLEAAVLRRGTTLADGGYVDAAGQAGDNAAHLHVYAREGQPCHRCSKTIQRVVQAQRSTFFCPGCQR